MYVIFIASLGPKFSYYVDADKGGLRRYLLVFEKLKDRISDFITLNVFKNDVDRVESKFVASSFRDRSCTQSEAQEFVNCQREKTIIFLKSNPDVKIFPADKGGRIVVTDWIHLDQNVKRGIYRRFEGLSFEYVRDLCEAKYEKVRGAANEVFAVDKSLGMKGPLESLCFEPYIISRIYGYFKIHKDDCPARPIVSATDCMAKALSKWLLQMLDVIAKHVGDHQIKSADELFGRVDGKTLSKGHVLVTWDFDSMFTNIPFSKTKYVIRKYFHLLREHTSMECDLFLECLSFLVEDNAFFTFGDVIYLQAEGLAMGNSLSQILAEITTSFYLNEAVMDFQKEEITFIYKYVDDIIAAMDESCVLRMQSTIESLLGMKLKIVYESVHKEVDYLQMRIGRDSESNVVHVRWIQKEYSSKRIIDFNSYHPQKMKNNVVNEFIRSALKLTSRVHWKLTVNALRTTLKNSNYPRAMIEDKVNFVKRSLLRVGLVNQNLLKAAKVEKYYVSCPYYNDAMIQTRKLMVKSGIRDVSLAPSIISNNRKKVFANLKDKRNLNCVKNSMFKFKCKDCRFSVNVFTNMYDAERTMISKLGNKNSDVYKHCQTNNHSMNLNVNTSSIVHFSNARDVSVAKNLLK